MKEECMPLSPGGTELMEEGLKACGFKKGHEILDIGCGTGTSVAFIREKFGLQCVGVDLSKEKIKQGIENHPELDLREMDAQFLDFPSLSFDGAIMECTLSLMTNPLEALHEAYCVLRKGGRLFVTDLYAKNPKDEEVRKMLSDALAAKHKPHVEGQCHGGEEEPTCADCSLDGAFVKELLLEKVSEAGFKILEFKDRSEVLMPFAAEMILNGGDVNAYSRKDLGYFMLIAEKP